MVGVVISVFNFNAARRKDAEARLAEAEARQIEAAKLFLELRQRLYLDTVQVVGILSNPSDHTEEELIKARKRFRELYVAELSMVEAPEVMHQMVALAREIDPELPNFTDAQRAAYRLSHALRDTFIASWRIEPELSSPVVASSNTEHG